MPIKMSWKELGDDPSPPQRPQTGGHGSIGRPILLTTNHFEVKVLKKSTRLYHYDVTVKDFRGNEALPKKKKMIIFEAMKLAFPRVFKDSFLSYDSMKNAYSTKNIPQLKKATSYEVALDCEGSKNKSKYTVSMVKVNEASLKELFDCMQFVPNKKADLPTTVIQMIEVMFRHHRAQRYEQVNSRNFFSLTGEFAAPNPIGGGKEGMTGFFGSLRPAAWKDGSILLNLDMAHTAFYKEQLVTEYIKETERIDSRDLAQPLSVQVIRRLDKNLRGLRIRVTHAMRTYKFLKVAKPANKIEFDYTTPEKGTKKVTVEEYMRLAYKTRLAFPSLNCFHVGNPEKKVYIPIELCKIDKGQKVVKKLTDQEVSTFIRSTAVPPAERLRQIKAVAATNNFKDDPMLKALTFSISDMPLQTKGRVLPAPSLTMEQKKFEPYQGVWDIRDKTFHKGADLKEWAVINYDSYKTRRDTLEKFLSMLVSMGNQKGMKMARPFDVYDHRSGEPNPLEDFQHYKKEKPNIQLIMCVLPARKYYGAIKKAGDTQVNIITQCVVGLNVLKCQPQTLGNLLLKMNAKMDGVNNIVSRDQHHAGLLNFKEPFLIMGADVNHPPAGGEKGIPSLAAVVGSYDLHATKYAMEMRSQDERKEIIMDLQSITKNLLKNFHRQTRGHKPSRIIMYRDGVSESQFKEVLLKEMSAMRKACLDLDKSGTYKPGITFICVQKRHHTRLFCDERDGVGKSKNVPPGTIVDKDITHPTEKDFFLCSHQGIQGTSKPTHYHVLWDDNDLPVDELQMLTYRLCHVYSRCARAVSIPTPVYYAHLAAFRAKVYVTEILEGGSESGSVMSGGSGGRVDAQQEVEIKRTTSLTIDGPLASRLHYI